MFATINHSPNDRETYYSARAFDKLIQGFYNLQKKKKTTKLYEITLYDGDSRIKHVIDLGRNA